MDVGKIVEVDSFGASKPIADTETALIAYVSRIGQQISTIETVFGFLQARGWINVEGNRVVSCSYSRELTALLV